MADKGTVREQAVPLSAERHAFFLTGIITRRYNYGFGWRIGAWARPLCASGCHTGEEAACRASQASAKVSHGDFPSGAFHRMGSPDRQLEDFTATMVLLYTFRANTVSLSFWTFALASRSLCPQRTRKSASSLTSIIRSRSSFGRVCQALLMWPSPSTLKVVWG